PYPDRRTAVREAEARLHPARRHGRFRGRGERRADRRHGLEARPEDVPPPLRLSRRAQEPYASRAAREAADRSPARRGQGHAPEEPARAPAAHEAEDLCRPRASARAAKPEALEPGAVI